MHFAILHVSDLHRDLSDEIDNGWLLDSLEQDFAQFEHQSPAICKPSICIVSGDLVYGVNGTATDGAAELERQYKQAEDFLVGLAEKFFDGDRSRVVVVPGNHDVCYVDVIASLQRIDVPTDASEKATLVRELFKPRSRLRWSWQELCFYRILDEDRYRNRFRQFSAIYNTFYQGKRNFSLSPDKQFDVFDFPDLSFSVLALNSCHNNDPLRRAGEVHPHALADGCRQVRHASRAGWITAAVWHHNLVGGPAQDDYLDSQFLQILMDAGVSLGFHGHQHLPECFDERYQLGPSGRKMTIVSASTLCAEPRNLRPGVPRSYNIVEIDTESLVGRVHQRQMVNTLFSMPVWGPGHFISSNKSFLEFQVCPAATKRPDGLDLQLLLDKADKLLGSRQWVEVIDVLDTVKEMSVARLFIMRALVELDDARQTIRGLWPPRTIAEAVTVGGAILDCGNKAEAENFVGLEFVSASEDASVNDISRRIRERWLR
jgi:hypothetical protein